jgi:hypothetical protein
MKGGFLVEHMKIFDATFGGHFGFPGQLKLMGWRSSEFSYLEYDMKVDR